MSSKQITMVYLDQLVSSKHQYRKFKDLFDFSGATEELKSIKSPAIVNLLRVFIATGSINYRVHFYKNKATGRIIYDDAIDYLKVKIDRKGGIK